MNHGRPSGFWQQQEPQTSALSPVAVHTMYISTRPSEAAWTMSTIMTISGSAGHRHQLGSQQQYSTRTPTFSPVLVWTSDIIMDPQIIHINMTSGDSPGHGQSHGPWASTQPLKAAWTMLFGRGLIHKMNYSPSRAPSFCSRSERLCGLAVCLGTKPVWAPGGC